MVFLFLKGKKEREEMIMTHKKRKIWVGIVTALVMTALFAVTVFAV